MALGITGIEQAGLYGETLTELYARVEPKLDKTGTKIDFELYYYRDKESFLAGGKPVKRGDQYSVEYTVNNDGYVLYGLHSLLISHLVESDVYTEDQLTILDIDAPI